MNSNFKDNLRTRTEYAEAVINKYLPESSGYTKRLTEAMSYSVLAGGKRLRPVFIDLSYSICRGIFDAGNESENDYRKMCDIFMAAMEYLHTYSLVHDDLPAIDNDDYRRGQLTTHKKFGEADAILAGDGLLHYAYELIGEAFVSTDKEYMLRAMTAYRVFAAKSGHLGMLGGQSVDVLFTGQAPDVDRLNYIFELKTCALIEASFMIGAIIGGADEATVDKFEQIGKAVGMAFQIKDDILDYTADEKELGKPTHSDEKNDKTTYVTLNGIDKAQEIVERYSKESEKILSEYEAAAREHGVFAEYELCCDLIDSLINRTH